MGHAVIPLSVGSRKVVVGVSGPSMHLRDTPTVIIDFKVDGSYGDAPSWVHLTEPEAQQLIDALRKVFPALR